MAERAVRGPVGRELSRRDLLARAGALGAGAFVASALPLAELLYGADPALAAVTPDDATLQAFADTIIPGRKAARTDLGDEIHADAIAGVDPDPGAVEADALRVMHDPLIGFDRLTPALLAEVTLRSLQQGGPFLGLPFDKRVAVMLGGLDPANPSRVVWEAAAAATFAAFCAAGEVEHATQATASGYRVMGYPGAAPNGYRGFSYNRRLSVERTRRGSLE
jgi:hypothetical protein